MKTIALHTSGLSAQASAALRRALSRLLGLRGCSLSSEDAGTYTICVMLDETFCADRYRIVTEQAGASLRAASVCAAFAAVGKLLRMSRFDGRGGFLPPKAGTEVDFTPKNPLRGMYFATHFHNFYHNAPIERVYDVIEDLALRGANSLLCWFDMHHYTSMRDPAAVAQVSRLRQILQYANTVGMGGALTMLSNEAFADSPVPLRAEWAAQNGYFAVPDSHYHLEICPSKEGGIAAILEARREMLAAFCDLKIDYVVYWPYDQGGCTCARCTPWGANGFVRLLPHFKALIKEMMPDTRVIVSTWYFDRFIADEFIRFLPLTAGEDFADIPYMMSFFFRGEMPDCVREYIRRPDAIPMIDFPEISMYSCSPWGGYGASVLTDFLDTTDRACAGMYHGGYPYSEGIFEDANKFMVLSRYTGEFASSAEALREYIRFELCCEDEELYEAIRRSEVSLARKRSRTERGIHVVMADTSSVEYVYRTLTRYRDLLPPAIAADPKFRLFYLRAVIDYELMTHDGYAIDSPTAQEAMREVNEIYYADEQTLPWVKAAFGQ